LLAAYPLALTGLPRASITICWKAWLDSHQVAGIICKCPKMIVTGNLQLLQAFVDLFLFLFRLPKECGPDLAEKFVATRIFWVREDV
jgi:hypothetical protein